MENKILLFSDHFGKSKGIDFFKELIGQKGIGLTNCDKKITPPFIIITYPFFEDYINNKDKATQLLVSLVDEINEAFKRIGVDKYIVRSSAKVEGFDERGFYESIENSVSKDTLKNAIKLAIEKNILNVSESNGNKFALIVQQLISPVFLGHLSNERRISRNKVDWLLEIVNNKGEFLESIKFNISNYKSRKNNLSYNCSTKKQLIKQLKSFAASNNSIEQRYHFEWIWDGKRFWVVQMDVEYKGVNGTSPGFDWNQKNEIIGEFTPKILHNFKQIKKRWKKIECIRVFSQCNLPQGEVFALENSNIIGNLIKQKRSAELTYDLKQLLLYPIVIRMDIAKKVSYDGVLLPRTETLFTLDDAYKFLFSHSKKFSEQGVEEKDFCFLIHRFIISKSCALAFAKPGIPRVRIDSTWGIVDGLYYHPHDSFEYNLTNSVVKKRIRCKTEYLDVDSLGKWFSKKSGSQWDWTESLTSMQIKNISRFTTSIADFLDKPVTVMYFVDVDRNTGYPTILPWFFTTEEIPESSEKFTDIVFSGVREIVTSIDDFNKLKNKIENNHLTGKFSIKLKLTPDILREKHFIEEIGVYCLSRNIPVELDGSILSHTYYILRKCGAKVRCVEPFDPKYKKQKFYKLVRDHIPVSIQSKGESATSYQLDAKEILKYLKEKAVEEAYEFFWEDDEDKIIEELADLYEVIRSTCSIFGLNMDELIAIAEKKSEKKGGFEKGTFLLETFEEALIKVVSHNKTPILELGFYDSESEHSSKTVKLLKKHSYIQSNDNSLILPYIYPFDFNNSEKKISQDVHIGNQIFIIEYNEKSILIKFKADVITPNPNQLSLEF